MITIRDLRKRFGDVRAVNDVSFEARDAAITGLLGANGAGKSTTLGMMAGLLQPDHGTVQMDGADPRGDVRRCVGAVLDHQGLYPRLTARENITYFGELYGLSGAVLQGRVDETIELLGLGRVADRRTLGFSQGERTKVALARALVHEPRTSCSTRWPTGSTSPRCAPCASSCFGCATRDDASSSRAMCWNTWRRCAIVSSSSRRAGSSPMGPWRRSAG